MNPLLMFWNSQKAAVNTFARVSIEISMVLESARGCCESMFNVLESAEGCYEDICTCFQSNIHGSRRRCSGSDVPST